jgi:hypothetical protein
MIPGKMGFSNLEEEIAETPIRGICGLITFNFLALQSVL